MQPSCHAAHTQVYRSASTLSCSPHTRAGLHSHVVCNPHACAGLHLCIHVVVQPKHTRGFAQPCRVQSARMRGVALASSCSLYSSAGLQPSWLSCSPHASAGLHPRCLVARTLQPHHPCSPRASVGSQPRCHAARTQVQVCIHVALRMQPGRTTTCHAASLTPVRPRAVTATLRKPADPQGRSSLHSAQASVATKTKIWMGSGTRCRLPCMLKRSCLIVFLKCVFVTLCWTVETV